MNVGSKIEVILEAKLIKHIIDSQQGNKIEATYCHQAAAAGSGFFQNLIYIFTTFNRFNHGFYGGKIHRPLKAIKTQCIGQVFGKGNQLLRADMHRAAISQLKLNIGTKHGLYGVASMHTIAKLQLALSAIICNKVCSTCQCDYFAD